MFPGATRGRLVTGLQAGGIGILASALGMLAVRAWEATLRIPLAYSGDGLVITSMVKGIDENGWWLNNPALAAPFGQRQYDYAHGGETIQLAALRLIGLFTDQPGTIVNLYYFVGFGVLAAVTFLVLRWLGTSAVAAGGIAVVYALLPYHFAHGTSHLYRSTYYSAPLAALLIIWCLDPEAHLLHPVSEARTTWRSRVRRDRLLKGAVLIVVIALTETMTTSFTMAVLVVSGLVVAMARRDVRRFALPAACAAGLFTVFMVASLPTLLFHKDVGSNEVAARRGPEESAMYGLRIARFVVPPEDHPLRPLASLGEKNEEFPDGTEAGTWIGFVGMGGVAAGLYLALTRPVPSRDDRPRSRLIYFSSLALVVALLIGTVEGLGKVAAVIGFSQVRTWNRISILIAFLAFYLIGCAFDAWPRARRMGGPARVAVIAVAVAFVLWDVGALTERKAQYDRYERAFLSDEVFVGEVEALLPTGSAVFQLPVANYPEDPSVARYDLMSPYLHSNHLRWSHGGVEGRLESDWRHAFDPSRLVDSVNGLIGLGFDGLTLHRDAWGPEVQAFEHALRATVGDPVIESPDGSLAFFDLRDYVTRADVSADEIEMATREVYNLEPVASASAG